MTGVCIIQVPFVVGDDRHAASARPHRYLEAGGDDVIAGLGIDVAVESIERHESFHDSVRQVGVGR